LGYAISGDVAWAEKTSSKINRQKKPRQGEGGASKMERQHQ